MNCRLLVLIGFANVEPYKTLRDVQMQTWLKHSGIDFELIFGKSKDANRFIRTLDSLHESLRFGKMTGKVVGKVDRMLMEKSLNKIPSYSFDSNGDFVSNSLSMYLTMNTRNFSFFNWFIKETEFTHVLSTTNSSYFDMKSFLDYFEKVKSTPMLFGGARFNIEQSTNFVSGSGRLMSRDLILKILETRNSFPAWRIEDLALSLHASSLGANFKFWKRLDFCSYDEFLTFKETHTENSGIFHFRIKTEKRPVLDAQIMLELDSLLRD